MKAKQETMHRRLVQLDKENFQIEKRRQKREDELVESRGGQRFVFDRFSRRRLSGGSKKSERYAKVMAIPRKRAGLMPRDPDRERDHS